MDNIAEWVAAAPSSVRQWLDGITVRNFIAKERRQSFNMPGKYDGAMSDECKRLMLTKYGALTELQEALYGDSHADR